MRGELWLHLAGGPEGGFIQRVEILANRTGRISRVNPRRVPVVLRRRVLLVGIRLDQAGIDCHALTADQTYLDAPRDRRLEQVSQKFALAEAPMSILGKRRMIRDPVAQIEAEKPAIREVQMHLFTKSLLGPDTEAIPDQQHPDQQFGIDRRAACVAVKFGQVATDAAQVDEPINGKKKMVLRNVIFQRELVKQRRLCFLLRS